MQSRRFSKLIPWLFAAPALIALTLFFVYPTIVTIILELHPRHDHHAGKGIRRP